MGMLISSIKEIQALSFKPFPGRLTSVGKVVRVGGVLFATSTKSDQVIYTTLPINRPDRAYSPRDYRWLGDLIRGLKAMRVVDGRLLEEHRAMCKTYWAMRNANDTLNQTLPHLEKTYGVKLNKTQRAKIERVAKTGK